jgi:hypothetical protein
VVSGFALTDRIEFNFGGSTISDATLNGSTITLNLGGSPNYLLTDVNIAAGSPAGLAWGTDSGTGDQFVQIAVCFAHGTQIATPAGDVPVEQLREGDRVYSHLSGEFVTVRWIGRRHIDCTRHPDPRKVWPVRVSAGALGALMPRRDVLLSPNHAVYVDDVLIPIKRLINGTTITQVRMDEVTYYHVELPQHDVLLAEGLPAESYLDVGDRSYFANGDAPMRLFPDFASPSGDTVQRWEALSCAELVLTGPRLEAVRRRVNALADGGAHAAAA